MVSWSDDKELSSGANAIGCETLNKKKLDIWLIFVSKKNVVHFSIQISPPKTSLKWTEQTEVD